MKTFKVLTIIFLGSLFIACGGSSTQKNNFSIQTNTENNAIQLGKTLELKLKNPKNIKVSSVSYTLDGNPTQPSSLIQDFKLGEHDLQATITYDGDTETVTQKLSVLNDTAPKILSYEIVNSYPHDITSYTQGLEFYNGTLYESTGQYGESKLRTLDYKAGTVTKNVPLAKEYFGEGLTVLNNNVYLLTWLEGTGFVYDAKTLERKSSFKYGESKEGWGLC